MRCERRNGQRGTRTERRARGSLFSRRAYQLIDAAAVVGNVKNFTQPPAKESQARQLTRLEPEVQQAVWADV